jgi:hypothetical protein
MQIAVKAMRIGVKTSPEHFAMSLEEFFVARAHRFQESDEEFPFSFPNGGKSVGCAILEGGCQFAFDRDPEAPILCIGCLQKDCNCPAGRLPGRYALHGFVPTRVFILDVDLNNNRPRIYSQFCKYHTLTYEEEHELRKMEERLKGLESLVFFYRTKCNGFRIGFDAGQQIVSREEYERFAMRAEGQVERLTPDGKLQHDTTHDGAWFAIDRIDGPDGVPHRSDAYWSYPRVYQPVWLNPGRNIP